MRGENQRGVALEVSGRGREGEDALVEQAVRRINLMWRRGFLDTVVAIGDYVIAEFYGGDLEKARAFKPRRPAALQRLYARADELPVSVHALKRAVRIAVQYHELPPALADGLSKSQHEVLLPVDDPVERQRLAKRAVAENLTVRDLERQVRRVYRPHPGGRSPEPEVLLRATALLRAAETPGLSESLAPAVLRSLGGDKIRAIQAQLRRVREIVERMSDALARTSRT